MQEWLTNLLNTSLRIELLCGDVTPIGKHNTGWSIYPGMLIAQLQPGRGRVRFEDGSVHRVKEGEAIVVPGGVRHCIEQDLPVAVSHWVHINFYVMETVDFIQFLEVPVVYRPPQSLVMRDAIETWAARRGQSGAQGPLHARVRECEMGWRLLSCVLECSRFVTRGGSGSGRMQSVWPAIAHINANFSEPLYRDTLLRRVNMSRAKFHRLFRQATGQTPMGYLTGVRMRHAQQQLLSSQASVEEIGRAVGYADPFVFSKRFKCHCGVSPRAYRQASQAFGAPRPMPCA